MEKSYIVAYTICMPGYVRTKFQTFTDFKMAKNFYETLEINILGKKLYESVEL